VANKVYYLKLKFPAFRNYYRIEAPTLTAAKKKLCKGTTCSLSDVVLLKRVRKGETRLSIPVGKS